MLYPHVVIQVADVVAISHVEVVKPHKLHVATCYFWQMLLPSGRWNGHYRVALSINW